MAFNISQVINKFLNVKIIDSDLRENPFNTAVGQEVVAVDENFWSRKLRHGKTAFRLWDAINLPTPGTSTSLGNYNPSVDKVFIPSSFTFGSDTDCIVKITYIPYANYDPFSTGYGTEYLVNTIVQAKTPFTFNFNGSLEIANGGIIGVLVTPITTAGKAYGCLHGIEVSRRA